MKETSREHRAYRRASDAPLEQAMRDIRAEQKLRPEEAAASPTKAAAGASPATAAPPGWGRSAQLAITMGWT